SQGNAGHDHDAIANRSQLENLPPWRERRRQSRLIFAGARWMAVETIWSGTPLMSGASQQAAHEPGAIPAWLADRLGALMREKLGPQATVGDVAPLPGHAGLGFSFSVSTAGPRRRLVIRTIADGVPPVGPAD